MWEDISIQYLNCGEMPKSTEKEHKPKVTSLHSVTFSHADSKNTDVGFSISQ